jgi:hypothetical protein
MNRLKSLWIVGLWLAFAQQPSAVAFEKVFGGPSLDRGIFVSPLTDGGYVAVGYTTSFGNGLEDVYLVRTDAHGELVWSKTYGGVGWDNGWSVHELEDGFILAGFTSSFGAGSWDFYLIKTDPDGDTLWTRTYGGAASDRCWALVPTSDGGFILAGETTSFGAGQEDFYVVRVDSTGTELWSKTYGGTLGDRCFSLALADDGGYMLAGQTYSEGAGNRDAYIVKIDSVGTLEWSRTFGGPASDVAHYVAGTTGEGFLVTGYTTSFAPAGDDPYLIHIDKLGDTLWTRVLSMDGINHTISGEQATDGGFLLVGFSDYPPAPGRAGLLVKTDADGHLNWYRDVLPTSSGESFVYTVRATPGGACVFTGHTTVGSASHFDLLLATACLIDLTGDVTGDGVIGSSDIIIVVNYVFKSGAPLQPCEAAGDANCDGVVTSADIIYLVNYVFKGGPPPCDVCTLFPGTWSCP